MKTYPPGRLQSADFARAHMSAMVDNDVTLEDVMTPGFWRDHAPNLKVGAILDVRRIDGTLDLTARVIGVGAGMVKLRPMFPPYNDERNIKAGRRAAAEEGEHDAGGLKEPDGYKIKHSPATGYFVLLPDGSNITQGKKGLSKPEAIKIAIEHHRQATTPINVS